MEADTMFAQVITNISEVFDKLQPKDYGKPTPDTEWDVRALANHLIYEVAWIPDMIAGRTTEEVGSEYDGDLVGEDATASWHETADRTLQAVQVYDPATTTHMSYADTTAGDYLKMVSGDLFIHGWDLAVALGVPYTMDPEISQIIYEGMSANAESIMQSGLFKPSIEVSADADIQTKLLAFSDRDPSWQAS